MNLIEEFPIVRSDTLPDNDATNFPDRGCRYSPSCLRCPLVTCVLDSPGWKRFKRAHDNSRAIMRALARGASVDDAAKQYGRSRRSVYRIQQRVREGDLTDTEYVPDLPEWLDLEDDGRPAWAKEKSA